MAGAFSLHQSSYRDAVRTMGPHGSVVTGFIQLASIPHAIVMAQIVILGQAPSPYTKRLI